MASVSIAAGGTKVARLGGIPPLRGKRGKGQGWTPAVGARNLDFLQSVDLAALSGKALGVTLTIPAASDHVSAVGSEKFHAMLRNLLDRFRRHGVLRWHWVIELTRVGTPHLHMAVWVPDKGFRAWDIVDMWREICLRHGLEIDDQAQVVTVMQSAGWLSYLAKHGARSCFHYQRDPKNFPSNWSVPGRMWGYGGDWPSLSERQPLRFSLSDRPLYLYRRWVRQHCIVEATKIKDARKRRRAIVAARRMLQKPNRAISSVQQMHVWIPSESSLQFIAALRHIQVIKWIDFACAQVDAEDWMVHAWEGSNGRVVDLGPKAMDVFGRWIQSYADQLSGGDALERERLTLLMGMFVRDGHVVVADRVMLGFVRRLDRIYKEKLGLAESLSVECRLWIIEQWEESAELQAMRKSVMVAGMHRLEVAGE